MSPYLMGIDLGTTTCRCAIFDLGGAEVASAYREITISYPRQLWAEVDPQTWWQSSVQVIREALARSGLAPEQVAGVGLSGLMHAPVLLDDAGQPIVPAMLWMDQRCAPQCEALNREQQLLNEGEDADRPFSTTHTAPKLRWLADTHPDLIAQARTLVLPKDFVRYRLTGLLCTDASDASGTGLFDRKRGAWNPAAARLARVPWALLPEVRSCAAPGGVVSAAAALETGLAAGTPVAVGGGDTSCTLIGAGALAGREVCIYLGTAAWIALVDRVGPDGRPAMAGFGATATTGAALRWARDLLAGSTGADTAAAYDVLTQQAGSAPPGAEGLFFLPHLMGERGPQPDPLARGALVGLTLRHQQPQIVRAVLEGTAFHLRRLLEACIAHHWPNGGLEAGVACGGAAHSPFWMQLLADVTHMTLRVPRVVEAGALGAAILGGVAAGVHSLEAARAQMAHVGRVFVPNSALARRYDALYNRYCRLDDLLAPWFRDVDPDEQQEPALQPAGG
jgi:xylulokinase